MVVALRAHNASHSGYRGCQEVDGDQVEHLVQAMELQRDAARVLASVLLQLLSRPHQGLARARGGGSGVDWSNWGQKDRVGTGESRGVGRGEGEYPILKRNYKNYL